MAVTEQVITDKYAVHNGDCVEIMQKMPSERVHLTVYSPPFGGLYHYSSNDRDLSNSSDYEGVMRCETSRATSFACTRRKVGTTAVAG